MDDLRNAFEGVATTGRFINGPEVTAFEEEIAAFIGVPHAIGVSSGTDALLVALMAHDISERKRAERQSQRLLELNEVSRNVATSLLYRDDLNQAISIILKGVGNILDVQRAYICRYRKFNSWV